MFNSINIATSGMVAQRIRINTAAMNIASADVVWDANENGPYRRRAVNFSVGMSEGDDSGRGVHVSSIERQNSFKWVEDPDNPYANADGFVKMPDIDTFVETVNAMEAQRAYEANLAAIDLSKNMFNTSLRILA
ncbi:MAG: flagellar basal body rod protein FlgC [Sedimentisphaerales bacterium]|nr:flagellar basal body rod protein FlgC [Sedimentisphaerales bacterium]